MHHLHEDKNYSSYCIAINNKIAMGSANSDITQNEFNKAWKVSDRFDHLTVWENKDNPNHQLEEYLVQDYDDPLTQRLYRLRRNSPYLVNAYSLQKDGFGFCETTHESTKVFVEKIPLRLSNVEDIPYPDVIHLYDACLNGFSQLTTVIGFFPVDEDFIGVNEQGQIRVWLNTAFESSSVLGNRSISEAEMVEGLLQIIHNATDQSSFPPDVPNLSDYIGIANNETTFESVKERFVSFVRQYNDSTIPLNLQCVHNAGGANQVNNWCRDNSSFGFQQNSMRLSQRFYQSKHGSKTNRSTVHRDTLQVPPAQYQSIYFKAYPQQQSTFVPQVQNQQPIQPIRQYQSGKFRTLPLQADEINFTNNVQTQSAPIPLQFQPTFIPINQTVLVQPPEQRQISSINIPSVSKLQPIKQESNKFEYSSSQIPQTDSRLQQQRVISQTIEIKDNFKTNQAKNNNEIPNPIPLANPVINNQPPQQFQFVQQASIPSQITTQNKSDFNRTVVTKNEARNGQTSMEDGKSSSEFLALISSLKNSVGQGELVQVQSQVADTPASYIKESSSSGKKYFNYPNFQETYSQDAFSNFGQDSNRHIDSTVINNYASSVEVGDKYSGQYNFSKYDRTIDPELMADIQHYK